MVGKEAQGSLCKQFLRPCLSLQPLLIDRNSLDRTPSVWKRTADRTSARNLCFGEHLTHCYWSAHAELQAVAKSTDFRCTHAQQSGFGHQSSSLCQRGVSHISHQAVQRYYWRFVSSYLREGNTPLLATILVVMASDMNYLPESAILQISFLVLFVCVCSNQSKQLPKSVILQDVWGSFSHSFTLEKSAALRFEKLSYEKRIERQELHRDSEV